MIVTSTIYGTFKKIYLNNKGGAELHDIKNDTNQYPRINNFTSPR